MKKIMSYLKKKIINFNRERDPHGWIQWKGTDLCIDIHCRCGKSTHFDGDFMYYIQCPYCERVYAANGFIELVEVINIKEDYIQTAEKDILGEDFD